MEIGRLTEKIDIYSVRIGQDSNVNDVQYGSFIISAFCGVLKTSNKDYANKSFDSVSTSIEKSLILRYQLKNYLKPTYKVLYQDSWYEIIDIEPDETYKDSVKMRIKSTNKGVILNG